MCICNLYQDESIQCVGKLLDIKVFKSYRDEENGCLLLKFLLQLICYLSIGVDAGQHIIRIYLVNNK